jgi:hypothetical protein
MVPCFHQTIIAHAAKAIVIKIKNPSHEHILCVEAIIGKKPEEHFNLGECILISRSREKIRAPECAQSASCKTFWQRNECPNYKTISLYHWHFGWN